MNLDKHLDPETVKICGCFDVNYAKTYYLHEKGYFAEDYSDYSDLSKCEYGELTSVDDTERPYVCKSPKLMGYFKFFLFENYVFNTVRPFNNVTEFLEKTDFKLGDEIIYKSGLQNVTHAIFTAYNDSKVWFGDDDFDMNDLKLEDVQYCVDGIWKPFGVEE